MLQVIMSASPLQGTVAIATARNPQWFAAISTVPQNQPGDSLEQVCSPADDVSQELMLYSNCKIFGHF